MCIIVMYKLSVGHAKILYSFFASMAGFRQNSAEFSAKPAGIRWPKNSVELSANSADNSTEFHSFKILLFLSHVNCISDKFFRFSTNFPEFFKIR
jgi:hypothetical protein